jgi:hypothetical protein
MTNGAPPIQETDQAIENDNQDSWRNLIRWLFLIPLILLLLFCCGQLALFGITPPVSADTGSNLEADYSVWSFSVIPRVLPEIINEIREDREGELDEVIIPGRVWPLLPAPTTEEPTPTSTSSPKPPDPTRTATSVPDRPTATDTIPPTPTSSPTISPSPTSPWVWIPSSTPTETPLPPTRTPTNIPSDTATITPEPTDTPTDIPIPTDTPSRTPTPIPIPSDTLTPSLTPSETQTPSETPTPTDSVIPSDTPTFTATPIPCSGNYPPGEPNIGLSNGIFTEFACGSIFIIDLVAAGSPPIDTTTADTEDDIRYYERLVTLDPTVIAFDWVTLQVGTGPSGACATGSWFTALDWGDMNRDNNGHLGNSYPEIDNERISISDLHGGIFQTGISIDLDAAPLGIPNQQYPCVRVISPINWPDNDGSEMDSLEILP